jgi:hypothetical protein
VTLFGRGKTGADLFPGLTRLIGDRDTGDYTALGGGSWDAAVDVTGYVPRHLGQAMDALADRVGRYLFISSHAVYERTADGSDSRPPARHRPVSRRDGMDDGALCPDAGPYICVAHPAHSVRVDNVSIRR